MSPVAHNDIHGSLYLRLAAVPAIWGGNLHCWQGPGRGAASGARFRARFLISSSTLLAASQWLEGSLKRLAGTGMLHRSNNAVMQH